MKTIGIYHGKFQPPHRGYLSVYKRLHQIVGSDTFIVMSDTEPTPDEPLNIGEREQIWARHGVPTTFIVNDDNWKHPNEVFRRYDGSRTAAIFVMNSKEAEQFSRRKSRQTPNNPEAPLSENEEGKEIWLSITGKPDYFQPYRGNESSLESFDNHGYVLVIDDVRIDGTPISVKNIRDGLASPKYTEDQKKKFFRWVFGWFDVGYFELMTEKFGAAYQSSAEEPPTEPTVPKSNKTIQNAVVEILKELYGVSASPSSDSSTSDQKDMSDTKTPSPSDLVKQKAQANKELDAMKKDLKWKQSDVELKRRYDLKNQQAKIDALSKQIAGSSSSTTT